MHPHHWQKGGAEKKYGLGGWISKAECEGGLNIRRGTEF